MAVSATEREMGRPYRHGNSLGQKLQHEKRLGKRPSTQKDRLY